MILLEKIFYRILGFVKLRVVKLTKDNKITCGHQYPKDVY